MTGLEIVDTAVKVGLGALIGAASGLCIEGYRRRSERKRHAEDRYRENIENPVVAFVTEMLGFMSATGWDKADGSSLDIDRLHALREKEGIAEARVAAMRNAEFSKSFRDLDGCFSSFRAELAEGKSLSPQARSLMREAYSHAGDCLRALYPPRSREGGV